MTARILLCLTVAVGSALATPFEEATITRVVKQVDLLNPDRRPQAAKVGVEVRGSTAVRSGVDSRTVLRFPDATITRLGANALFRFDAGTRKMNLEQGTILFSPPKGVGGGDVQMGAVTAAVAGTTFLASHVPGAETKVIVLEGKVIIHWKGFLFGKKSLGPGEMFVLPLNVPNGKARVSRLELRKLLATSRLLESGGFSKLAKMPEIQRISLRQKPFDRSLKPQINGTQEAQVARRVIKETKPRVAPKVPSVRPKAPSVKIPPVKPPKIRIPRPPDDTSPPPITSGQ